MSDQTQPTQEKKVAKPKGNKVTETIIGAASNKMVSATKLLRDAAEQALKLTETMDDQALRIAENEDKINNLQTEFNNKRNQNKVDLELEYRADRKGMVEKYAQENQMALVPRDEYNELNSELIEWKQNFNNKVNSEVGKAVGMEKSRFESEKKLLDAEYRAKEAGNLSKIEQLESQLKFANDLATKWEQQLKEERQASIERSKNQSATVNVAPSQGR